MEQGPDNIHWRPNCRLFKVDKSAVAMMATLKANGTQHQQQAPAPNNNTTSPDSAAAAVMAQNGKSPGRSKLKLHFKGLKGVPAAAGSQQPPPRDPQQQQPVAAAAGRPPAAPGRLSVPPSPSPQLQPAGDSGGLLSPDSAGGPSPGGRDWSAVLAKAEENAAKRGCLSYRGDPVSGAAGMMHWGGESMGWTIGGAACLVCVQM